MFRLNNTQPHQLLIKLNEQLLAQQFIPRNIKAYQVFQQHSVQQVFQNSQNSEAWTVLAS